MQVIVKLFLVTLIIENSTAHLCNQENVNCNIDEIKFSDHETSDLGSWAKNVIKHFYDLNKKNENRINTIADDIGYIRNSLERSNCSNTQLKNVTKVPSPIYGNLWVVIQRRQDGSQNFYRSWDHYKRGFGNTFREFFIGLDKIHYLTSSGRQELLVKLENFKNNITYALYDEFLVGNESENYYLKKLGNYSGNAGDYMRNHVGMHFSTKDRDNDASNNLHCAKKYQGGWWYNDCLTSNLNGPFRTRHIINNVNITWGRYDGVQVKIVQMMIRSKRQRDILNGD